MDIVCLPAGKLFPAFPPSISAKSRRYFSRKAKETEQLLHSLADEKSKQTLCAQQAFRQKGTPLPLGSAQDHYFPPDVVSLSAEDVFVDTGAFTGDSIRRFQKACKGQYKQIIALEANPDRRAQLQAKTKCLSSQNLTREAG